MKPENEIWSDELVEKTHVLSRVYGGFLLAFSLFGIIVRLENSTAETVTNIIGVLLAIEGLGNLVTGKHHYASMKAVDFISDFIYSENIDE